MRDSQETLEEKLGEILSYVEQVGDIRTDIDMSKVTMEKNIIRRPDQKMAENDRACGKVRGEGDSIGAIKGIIRKSRKALANRSSTIGRPRQSHALH